ncbi:MAG: NAD(P)/FAD-dependent oxidoreductase, partial [Calditrichaeota bacterium]
FPRDKICGDAISGKSIIYLRELGLLEELEKAPHAFVDSILFSSPRNDSVVIKLIPTSYNVSQGYVCRRMVYDHILFRAAQKKVETLEGFAVQDLLRHKGQVIGVRGRTRTGEEKEFTARVVVGADGFSSIVARKTGVYKHIPEHWLVATRAYYRGVSGLSSAIELHYVETVLPGYFWIFPLEDGLANVGLGMVHSELKKKGIRLKQAHIEATESPEFRERFRNAELIGDIVGSNLPVGSYRRQVHGDGFLLVGDAAGLVDPFTGEGIGNAMASAKIAAEALAEVCRNGNYRAEALNIYAQKLWKTLGPELDLSYRLQRTARITPLLNLVIRRASRSREVADWISGMIAGTVSKRELLSPFTYLKLLFKK